MRKYRQIDVYIYQCGPDNIIFFNYQRISQRAVPTSLEKQLDPVPTPLDHVSASVVYSVLLWFYSVAHFKISTMTMDLFQLRAHEGQKIIGEILHTMIEHN